MPKVPDAYRKARSAEILSAAAACFARAGYQRTSMADIAREASLSVGALYRYYESKEALFHALARSAREANEALWAEVAGAGGPAAQLRSLLKRFLDMTADPECLPSLACDIRLRSEALDFPVVREELQAAYRAQIDNIARRLRAAKGRGAKTGQARTRARAVIGLLNEAAAQALLVPGLDLTSYRREVQQLIETWTDDKPE